MEEGFVGRTDQALTPACPRKRYKALLCLKGRKAHTGTMRLISFKGGNLATSLPFKFSAEPLLRKTYISRLQRSFEVIQKVLLSTKNLTRLVAAHYTRLRCASPLAEQSKAIKPIQSKWYRPGKNLSDS